MKSRNLRFPARVRLLPFLTLAMLPLLAPPAFAADGDANGSQAITLHLSASGSVKVPPDELVADLAATAQNVNAVVAQRRVNGLIASASETARKTPEIDVSALGYSVSQDDDRHPRWTAQQTLEIRGKNAEAVLNLVAQLQALGLTITSLDWQLSDQHWQMAHQAAIVDALKRLRADAEQAAGALGLKIDHFQEITLDDQPRVYPMPRLAMSSMAMAPGMPAPEETPDQQTVSAEASADIRLRQP